MLIEFVSVPLSRVISTSFLLKIRLEISTSLLLKIRSEIVRLRSDADSRGRALRYWLTISV